MNIKRISILIITVTLIFVKVADTYAHDALGGTEATHSFAYDMLPSAMSSRVQKPSSRTREQIRLELYCQWVESRKAPIRKLTLEMVNEMSRQEWERVPGIGPALATSIVEFRETEGSFGRMEDLCKVKGIGEKKLKAIMDLSE